jgi:hypothetical protein
MKQLKHKMVIQEELLDGCFDELQPLISRHWLEVDPDQEEVPLAVDWNRLREMLGSKLAFLLTVRDDNVLVGYLLGMVGPHLHYRLTLCGMTDAYWIAPDYRRGTTGLRLFIEAERSMKARGAVKLIGQSKTAVENDVSALFEYLGWSKAELIFTKVV